MRHTVKLPNRLIADQTLSLSARRVGAVIYSRRNALGVCRKTLEQLGNLSHCAVGTVRKAVCELEHAGYITCRRTYRFLAGKGVVYGTTEYHCDLGFAGGFTLVPRVFFSQDVSDSGFSIYIYLCFVSGNRRRCFPSLSRVSANVGIARATVCRALKQLKRLPVLFVQLCRKVNRAFSCNSYFFCESQAAPGQGVSPVVSAVSEPAPIRSGSLLSALKSALKGFFSRWLHRLGTMGSLIFDKLC